MKANIQALSLMKGCYEMTEVIVVYKCESSLLRGVMAPEAFLNEMLRPPPSGRSLASVSWLKVSSARREDLSCFFTPPPRP